jgi:hypothetical protein
MTFADLTPASTGIPDVDRRAKFILGERLEGRVERQINSLWYEQADDAARKDRLLKITAREKTLAARHALKEFELRRTKRREQLRGAPRVVPRRSGLPFTSPLQPPGSVPEA